MAVEGPKVPTMQWVGLWYRVRNDNGFAAWNEVTSKHNSYKEAILFTVSDPTVVRSPISPRFVANVR